MQEAAQHTRAAGLRRQPLVTRGETAGSARRDDARGVGVPAPARVALGHHERVLAERREVLATERAAIGGGLEVLGAAHRPPAWLLGHRATDATARDPSVVHRLARVAGGRDLLEGVLYHLQSAPTSHPDLRLIQFAPADGATRDALARLIV